MLHAVMWGFDYHKKSICCVFIWKCIIIILLVMLLFILLLWLLMMTLIYILVIAPAVEEMSSVISYSALCCSMLAV